MTVPPCDLVLPHKRVIVNYKLFIQRADSEFEPERPLPPVAVLWRQLYQHQRLQSKAAFCKAKPNFSICPGRSRDGYVAGRLKHEASFSKALLRLLTRIRHGTAVTYDPASGLQAALKLSGVVVPRPDGRLAFRNEIYDPVWSAGRRLVFFGSNGHLY